MTALLPVKHVSQITAGALKWGNDCLAAAGCMLVEAFIGKKMTPDEFYQMTGQVVDKYLSVQQGVDVLRRLGVPVNNRVGMELVDVFKLLSERRPLIVLHNYEIFSKYVQVHDKKFKGEHFSVMVGMDTTSFYIHDPDGDGVSYGTAVEIRHANWMEAWNGSALHGNIPCQAIIPELSLGTTPPAPPASGKLYTVVVTAVAGLTVRRQPKVVRGNEVGYYALYNKRYDVISEKAVSSTEIWVEIKPGQWMARMYAGQEYARRV